MNSMTGYGYKEAMIDGTQVSVEFRSVNSRFLDLNINMPSYMNPLESKIRSIIASRVTRGKLDVSIRIHDEKVKTKVTVDEDAARSFYNALKSLSETLGCDSGKIPLSLVVSQDGVLSSTHEYDADAYWKKIEGVFEEVFDSYEKDRKREGENLKKDLLEKLTVLDQCADFFREWQPKMEQKFKETITAKFKELLGDNADENRIMTETAALLVKYTINEEIIRLHSHLKALRDEINSNPIPGKRIDFICQEANREINTIGSKNQFVEVGQKVINAKDALENIREQSKNVE